jgi:hypothetical protein
MILGNVSRYLAYVNVYIAGWAMDYQQELAKIGVEMTILQEIPAGQGADKWRALAMRVDALCHDLAHADPVEAHAVLPSLGNLIRELDQMILESEQDDSVRR